jgi:hypothetical protein
VLDNEYVSVTIHPPKRLEDKEYLLLSPDVPKGDSE